MTPAEFIVVAIVVMLVCLLLTAWARHRTGPVDDEGGIPTVHRMAGRARYVFAALGVIFIVAGLIDRSGQAVAGGILMLAGAAGQHWVYENTRR